MSVWANKVGVCLNSKAEHLCSMGMLLFIDLLFMPVWHMHISTTCTLTVVLKIVNPCIALDVI